MVHVEMSHSRTRKDLKDISGVEHADTEATARDSQGPGGSSHHKIVHVVLKCVYLIECF